MDQFVLLICLFILVTGASIGSFLNVVALRGLSRESIVFPASKCPSCGTAIKWYDNIPVLSYLFTFKGKCRSCGCKVSKQYPIVEALTAILFLLTTIVFGLTPETLLILLLLCVSIVMTITDIKEEALLDTHLWVFIATSIVYAYFYRNIGSNLQGFCIDVLVAVVFMEAMAKGAYYVFVKPKLEDKEEPQENKDEENSENKENKDEDIDPYEYMKKYKRIIGEGDTYLAAGISALLGWKIFFIILILSAVFQVLCILPQYLKILHENNQARLLFSLSGFTIMTGLYIVLSNLFNMSFYVTLGIMAILIFFAFDVIKGLRNANLTHDGVIAPIPWGPSLLVSTFVMLYFGNHVISLIKKYILFMF